ncbi:MAG TPA: hypothetical protein DCW90_05300 [Lachnospiraceae bacterium]|nr:hypothetical protein [Lachnospiraceae bacterium]
MRQSENFSIIVLANLTAIVLMVAIVAFFMSTIKALHLPNVTTEVAADVTNVRFYQQTGEHILSCRSAWGDVYNVSLNNDEYAKYIASDARKVVVEQTNRNGKRTYKILGVSE